MITSQITRVHFHATYKSKEIQKVNQTKTKNISFELNYFEKSLIKNETSYNQNGMRINKSGIEQLLSESEEAGRKVKDLITGLLGRQGIPLEQFQAGAAESINIDEIAKEEAQKLLAPGGILSPGKVSDRIVDFAIFAFGNNKNKIGEIKAAIDEGFVQARKAWGGALPGITDQTYQQIQEKLETWENS